MIHLNEHNSEKINDTEYRLKVKNGTFRRKNGKDLYSCIYGSVEITEHNAYGKDVIIDINSKTARIV